MMSDPPKPPGQPPEEPDPDAPVPIEDSVDVLEHVWCSSLGIDD